MVIMLGDLYDRGGDTYIFGPHGLTTAKYAMLATIAGSPVPLSMTQLRECVMKSAANLTQMIDALERDGLVRRQAMPKDRRVNLVEITDAGRDRVAQVEAFMRSTMAAYFQGFSDTELREFARLLQHFAAHELAAMKIPPIPPHQTT
ncbi:MarR family transcriptional regulator [candidate division KSB1 bacterium]|nr:MarR family transcriptional regulator [candidate division KSB1 bacterium]